MTSLGAKGGWNRQIVAVVIIGVLLGPPACAESDTVERDCVLPAAANNLELLPKDIPLDRWGTVHEIAVSHGFMGATAVTDTGIEKLYPVLTKATADAGYNILGGENEGFEAEIFFERGEGTTGAYRLREGPCGDQVTIRLLYEAPRYRRLS